MSQKLPQICTHLLKYTALLYYKMQYRFAVNSGTLSKAVCQSIQEDLEEEKNPTVISFMGLGGITIQSKQHHFSYLVQEVVTHFM